LWNWYKYALAAARRPPVKNALIPAYHKYVRDRVLAADHDIFTTIVIPHWNPDLSMEELDRLGDEEGFVAAQQGFSKMCMWGAPENDPVFECLTDFDLPLALHPLGITGQFDHQRQDADLPELQVVDVGTT
jgi:hypothetical protein